MVEFEQAISDYDQAITLDPELAPAYLSRGSIYLFSEDYQDCTLARADLEHYLELRPNDPQADAIESELALLCPP